MFTGIGNTSSKHQFSIAILVYQMACFFSDANRVWWIFVSVPSGISTSISRWPSLLSGSSSFRCCSRICARSSSTSTARCDPCDGRVAGGWIVLVYILYIYILYILYSYMLWVKVVIYFRLHGLYTLPETWNVFVFQNLKGKHGGNFSYDTSLLPNILQSC